MTELKETSGRWRRYELYSECHSSLFLTVLFYFSVLINVLFTRITCLPFVLFCLTLLSSITVLVIVLM